MATRELSIQEKLHSFAERWHDYHSTELAGAQSYLRHLLECYDADEFEPGELFEQHPVRVVEPQQSDLFNGEQLVTTSERMDMYIPRICVWEMKGPEEHLQDHYDQVLRYWVQTRPRYMVLCNFHEIWVYDTDEPQGLTIPHKLTLAELSEKHEALLFLRGDESYFPKQSEQVTKKAAAYIGKAVRQLIEASDDRLRDRERITKFALECVFAMFGEDTELIPGKLFEQAMKKAQGTGDLSPVYTLFDDFGREDEFDRSTPLAPYINGPLFDRKHPKLRVDKGVLSIIYAASQYDWTAVRPEVFGSIFEQAIDPAQRHELGAHFTAEADIMKVVGPTVVRPWRERIKAVKTHKDCEALIERMQHYHVLDPACGSGNFLYVVYRELKRLERALMDRWEERYNTKYAKRKQDRKTAPPGPYFTVEQLHGIDKDEIAVQLTRVVLWIGQHLASRESEGGEVTLPLKDLSANIIKADALFTDWFRPEDDGMSELAIVGNPPYLGRYKIRLELSDKYAEKIFAAFPQNKNADLVTYWYSQAINTLLVGERFGFVSTNSIGQNENREASIEPAIAKGFCITEAWKSYPWPGEAAVHVSIVNMYRGTFEGVLRLNGYEVAVITPRLTSDSDLTGVAKLPGNAGISYKAVEPGNNEFIISSEQAERIANSDPKSSEVIRPIIIGRDVNRDITQQPTRMVIDFNMMSMDEAMQYVGAFRHVQKHVYPARCSSTDRKTDAIKAKWWIFHRPRPAMRRALAPLDHYLVVPHTSPYCVFVFANKEVIPDHALIAIAFDTYYHYGVLQSAIHEYWAWARGSTLKGDLRYTNTTIFETFPFPLTDSRDPLADDAPGGAGILPAIAGAGRLEACPTKESTTTESTIKEGFTAYRRRLPHWRMPGSVYFVTWRIQPDRETLPGTARKAVADALHHFDAERYELLAYVVMDDHVHVLLSPSDGYPLADIVHSWKSFTANEINKKSGKSGTLWLDEYFDRIMRDEEEVLRKTQYILNNPSKRWPEVTGYEYVWCKWLDSGSEDGRLEACPTKKEAHPVELLAMYDPRAVPDTPQARRVSDVAEELYAKRQAACIALNLGLTKLYNYIKGKSPLANLSTEYQALVVELQALHEQLNDAVCVCYGWPEDTWRDENEVLKRLLALNLALTSAELPIA